MITPTHQADEPYLEQQKVALDYLKHLTTLATGALAFLVTFLGKDFFPKRYGLLAAGFSLLQLVLAVVFFTVSCTGVLRSLRDTAGRTGNNARLTATTFTLGVLFFLGGLVAMVIFVWLNLR